MQYRILGLDLDGTLLDDTGTISDANRQAIAKAQAAGMYVVPCTGRGWREAKDVLAPLPGLDLGVFVTGAAVVQMATGRSVDLSVIEPNLALELVHFLQHEPEAVLAYREASLAGHDYLVTGYGQLSGNTEWWFQNTGATVRFQRDVTADDLHHTLRVGLVASGGRLPAISERIGQVFESRVLLHHFAALPRPELDQSTHVLEIFADGVDKWRGLKWIADQLGIGPEQIATIGDSVNDLSMLTAAGCGIAMANAIDEARACADRITISNQEHGVAYAIEQMLRGIW